MRISTQESWTTRFTVFSPRIHRGITMFLTRGARATDPRPSPEARPSGSAFVSPWLLLFAVLSLSACGYIGNPQAPTLDIPQGTSDLRVVEYGDKIRTEFTIPLETTEGLPLKSVRAVELRIGTAPTPWNESAWAAAATPFEIPAPAPGPLTFDVVPSETLKWVGKEVIVGVRATGPKGKTSRWSNLKTLQVQPPLAKPTDLKIQSLPTFLYVSWSSPAKKFRVFWQIGDDPPEILGQPDNPNFQETRVEFGVRYRFYVQAIAGDDHQSELAETQPYTRIDDFVPTLPAGLTGEEGANAVNLSWERNTDPRFQGYNVYRSVNGGPLEKIASLIIAPAYTDSKVEAGKKYLYRVTAVGTNGIESEKSTPFEMAVQ
jgi:hypothetical protein